MEDSRRALRQGTVFRGKVEDESRERYADLTERSSQARTVPVSNPNSIRFNMRGFEGEGIYGNESSCYETDSGGQAVPNSDRTRFQEQCESIGVQQALSNPVSSSRRGTESSMGSMADGLASELDGDRGVIIDENYINLNYWNMVPEPVERVKRDVPNRTSQLKALGNAVVPQQIYPIFKAIIEVSQRIA